MNGHSVAATKKGCRYSNCKQNKPSFSSSPFTYYTSLAIGAFFVHLHFSVHVLKSKKKHTSRAIALESNQHSTVSALVLLIWISSRFCTADLWPCLDVLKCKNDQFPQYKIQCEQCLTKGALGWGVAR